MAGERVIFDPILPLALVIVATVLLAGIAVWRMLRGPRSTRLRWELRLVMVVLLLVIALRPSIAGSGTGPVASGGLEVYFAVDTTSSMAAEDAPASVGPVTGEPATRLDAAKADIAGILAALPGAQFSLTTFDSTSVQRVPLTSDATALASAANAMTQEVTAYSSGSSISEPVQFLTDLLATAARENPNRERVIFYLGDGEQTRQAQPESFAALAPFIRDGAVIGYGSGAGGEMRAYDGFDDGERLLPSDDPDPAPTYITDPSTGERAISRVDEQNLRQIATQLGVAYLPSSAGDVSTAVSGIDVGEVTVTDGSLAGPIEFYWIFAIPLALIAIGELMVVGTAVADLRPRRSAASAPPHGSAPRREGGRP